MNECSLQSCEIMSEVDSTLWSAKEKPHLWFGGVMVIFAGDLYQYPPVGGTALYTPTSAYTNQTDKEIKKRLGCLVWKTVNTVVSLTEQERMKGDPEYGAAVRHLRIHINLPKETLNVQKSQENCKNNMNKLTICAALDTCPTRDLSRPEWEQLLNLNMSSSKLKDSLPGFIPLYVGMPIVLRSKNISMDLGITNGSQGIVRKIYTKICPTGFTYCTSVLVEFPDSKIALLDLPKGYFLIMPIKTTFSTVLTSSDGAKLTIQLTRCQVPVQLAFAITGQSAQGKTLPCVLANLHEGGFGAYVTVSRAQNQYGLCITEPVTLQDLNKPVPHTFLFEEKRLCVLEHNTYIKYGFAEGNLVTVPKAYKLEMETRTCRTT